MRLSFFLCAMCICTLVFCSFMPPLNPTIGGNETAIHWLTMEEAYQLQQKNPKKIIVDIYAEWCGWCKRMDNTTFQEPAVIRYINDNFYAVKLDAETKRTIKLGDESFNYRSNGRGGMNELAMELAGNQLSLPTVVLLNEKLSNRLVAQAYQSPTDMDAILHYYASGAYDKGMDWEQYKKTYVSSIK